MKRALLATGAAVILAAAAFVTPADARGRGGGGGGSGGHAHSSSAGFARNSGISSGGSFSRNGGSFSRNAGSFSRNGGSFSRNAVVPNSVVRNSNVGRNFAGVHHRRHFRRGFVAFGPGYASYGYADGCVVPQRVLTNYGWQIVYVNVCGYDDDDY